MGTDRLHVHAIDTEVQFDEAKYTFSQLMSCGWFHVCIFGPAQRGKGENCLLTFMWVQEPYMPRCMSIIWHDKE